MGATVYTIQGPGGPKRRKRRRKGQTLSSGGTCTLGDSKRVNAGRGHTQELACTGKGPTGWTFVKGTRRRK